MSILPAALVISAGQLLLLSVAGLGAARLLLPPRLHAHELTLAPLFGLALLALAGLYGSHAGLTMRQMMPLVLVLAGVLLGGALVRAWRGGRRWGPGLLPLPELVPLLLMMAGTWLLCIAPVLTYGTLMPIGDNWDVEFYLPLADYLKDYSALTLDQAPPNPLRDLLLTNRLASRAMGATYAQAMADLLVYREAWDSWVPMLALLRALTLAPLYALLREGLKVSTRGALAGVGLAGVNSLLLWTTYNSFGMGLGGLALLPAALVCTLLALEEDAPRPVLAAVLLLGGLSCTYWPMLMAYGAACLGLGLALLWEHRHGGWREGWGRVVRRGVAVLVGGAVVGGLAHLRAPDAFFGVFGRQVASMGISDFISPAVMAGSAPFSHRSPTEPVATTLLEAFLIWGGMGAALLLLVRGMLVGSGRRRLVVGMVGCLLLYLLGLRFVVHFPYGYVRGASYVNSLLLGVVGAGIGGAWAASHSPRASLTVTAVVAHVGVPLLLLLLVVSGGIASIRTSQVYAGQPGVFGLETVGMRAAISRLDQPGPVALSPAPELRGPYMGALAYALRGRELLGVTATGYQPFVNTHPDATPRYAVIRDGEDPRAYGMTTDARLWGDGRAALYAAPPERVAWLNGRPTALTEGSLLMQDTTLSRARVGIGSHLEVSPTVPLTLSLGSGTIGLEPPGPVDPPAPDTHSARRTVSLMLASFVSQTVEITVGEGDQQRRSHLDIPAGAHLFHTGLLTVPTSLTLRGGSDAAPLLLRWVSLNEPDKPTEAALAPPLSASSVPLPLDDTLLLGVASKPPDGEEGNRTRTRLQLANPGSEALRLAVEIYEDRAGYDAPPLHYAWSLFPAPSDGVHLLELDLRTPAMWLDGTPLPVQTDAARGQDGDGDRDGDRDKDRSYFAALWVYQGEQVQRVIPFLRFEHRGSTSTIEAIASLDVNGVFVRLRTPETPASARFGDRITLRGFELAPPRLRAGKRLWVSLLWEGVQSPEHLFLVFVQVLDANDRKIAEWNGAAGGEWHPTPSWEPGQQVWQDVPLDLASDAPPGRYRVIVGLFDPVTGERLRLQDGSDFVQVGEVEVEP